MNYMGNLELLNKPCIGVTGSRKIDDSSKSWLRNKLKGVKASVVSGLAIGTDTVAHEYCLENNIPTIAILPSGLHNIYPKVNRKLALEIVDNGGLLLTEYDNRTPANRNRFIERNKIISEISSFLIVPQFDKHSGTRHTIDFAQKMDKTIYVRKAGYSGNQYIIHNKDYRTVII